MTAMAAAALLTACGGTTSSTSSSSSVAGLCSELESSASNCSALLATAQAQQTSRVLIFEEAVKSLEQTTAAYCDAIGQANESTALSVAMVNLNSAATAWQALEPMQFGPITESVRNEFYSWPISVGKEGQIDAEIALVANGGAFAPTPSKRGLTAMEYILYNNPEQSARCDYAKRVAGAMVPEAEALSAAVADYQPAQSTNQQAEVQSVFNALFYLDTETKSEKIQDDILPEGQNDSFGSDNLEYPFANLNRAAVQANLESVLSIFTGDSAVGFEDILIASSQAELASSMRVSLQAAVNAVQESEFSNDWRTVLANANATDRSSNVSACLNVPATTNSSHSDLEKLCSLPKKIQPFTTDLKGAMSIALNLSVPNSAASDGD